jgi:hypothetical protein
MKPLSFSDMKHIQRMNLNELNRWVLAIYRQANIDGRQEALKDAVVWDMDDLKDRLLEIPQVGEKRASDIMDAVMEEEKETAKGDEGE